MDGEIAGLVRIIIGGFVVGGDVDEVGGGGAERAGGIWPGSIDFIERRGAGGFVAGDVVNFDVAAGTIDAIDMASVMTGGAIVGTAAGVEAAAAGFVSCTPFSLSHRIRLLYSAGAVPMTSRKALANLLPFS